MAVAMARRVAADTAATVLPDAGDIVVAITLAQRRLGRRLGEDEEWKFFYDEIFNAEAQRRRVRRVGWEEAPH